MTVPSADAGDEPVRRGPGGRPRVPGLTGRILDATIAIAAEVGIDDLTLDTIAARAEVGRPTIYRRWASKEALLADAIERMVDEYYVAPETGNIRDDLVEFARRNIVQVQSPLRTVWLAYFNMEQAHLASPAMQRAGSVGVEIVRRGIERGELRSDANPLVLLELIFAPIWYRSSIGRAIDPEFAESIVDAVLNSWLTPRQSRRTAADKAKPRR
jgi:AcrR family transcriptional regulator